MPKVSIVLPTYNGSKYIRQSIESVINQTFEDFELIIVNDCSTDETLSICLEYQSKDPRVIVISNEENKKLPASLNIGFSVASGMYFTWTSDDNFFKKNAIEVMLRYLEENPKLDMVSCNYDVINENDRLMFSTQDRFSLKQPICLAYYNNIGACFMYTKELARKIGEYDDKTFCVEDYDYWCRAAIVGNINYVDDNLYVYRTHSKSLTANNRNIIEKRTNETSLKYICKILKRYQNDNKILCRELVTRSVSFKRMDLFWNAITSSIWYSIRVLFYVIFFNKIPDILNLTYKRMYENRKFDEVIIWGTGEYGMSMFNAFNKLKFKRVRAFCNSFQPNDAVGTCNQLPVLSPFNAAARFTDAVFLIASDYSEQILRDYSNSQLAGRIYCLDSECRNFEKAFLRLVKEHSAYNLSLCLNAASLMNLCCHVEKA